MTLLPGPIFEGASHVNNISAIGGTWRLTAAESPYLVAAGNKSLPIGTSVKAEQ